MHCWIELNRASILNNYKIFCDLVGKDRVAPVLKSNAYGHGLAEYYEVLKQEVPKYICVAYLSEAELLRKQGYAGRIIMVAPVFAEEFDKATVLDAEILMTDKALLNAWLQCSKKPKIHVKFDTGLSRQGFFVDQAEFVAQTVIKNNVQHLLAGVCTHFANVEDVLEQEFADLQLSEFEKVVSVFNREGLKPLRHAASSAASLILEKSRFDLVRVGIAGYGFWPSSPTRLSFLQLSSRLLDLQPVLSWKTKVSSIKVVKAGSYIGYGCSYKTNSDTKIAVLPVGYSEGFPRIAGEAQSYVLINGTRCKLLGRVSMNLMVVDVSHLTDVFAGDVVTLIGNDGQESIGAATLADWASTIHYEVVTRLNAEIPRIIS